MANYKFTDEDIMMDNKLKQHKLNIAKVKIIEMDIKNTHIDKLEEQLTIYKNKVQNMINLIKTLDQKEQLFIVLKYFEEKNNSQIADIMNISTDWVAHIRKKILRKLIKNTPGK